MDIGIVTSFYNGYDRFIERWANSICRLTIKPAKVVMIASGPEADLHHVKNAEKMFDKYNIPYVSGKLMKHQSMGYARNKAVEHCDTRWVMYLDVDDTIVEKAIEHFKKYEKNADVICSGLKIVGARKHEVKLYPNASTENQLKGKIIGSSHCPFRKKFWKLAPFTIKNDYIEQVFKLGMAQQGARFVPTKEVCTIYHSRADGHNLSMTKSQWKECKAQTRKFVKEGVQYD